MADKKVKLIAVRDFYDAKSELVKAGSEVLADESLAEKLCKAKRCQAVVEAKAEPKVEAKAEKKDKK